MNEYMKMLKQLKFRKQTEEAKFEAFSLMCKKVADLEKENAELKEHIKADCIDCADYIKNQKLEKENSELKTRLQKTKKLIKKWLQLHNSNTKKTIIKKSENFLKE